MDMDEYQTQARKTAIYPVICLRAEHLACTSIPWLYPVMGLSGEAGEILEKCKKLVRDSKGTMTMHDVVSLKKELGDALWYLSQIAWELGFNLNSIAEENLWKLRKRSEEDKLHGEGDSR